MTTNRTPVELQNRLEITEAACRLFLELEHLRQVCDCDRVHQDEPCASCVTRRKVHNELNKELGLRPWNWILGLWKPGKPYWEALMAAARELRLAP